MKRSAQTLFSVLSILVSCSEGKKDFSESIDFNLIQDTVIVDSKGGNINLKYGLSHPELSHNGKYLFHYSYGEARFDKINLEKLELEETLQFEKEGPNGMGTSIGGYALTSEDHIMIWSYGLNAIFDQTGEKVKDLRLDKIAQDEIKGAKRFPIRLIEQPGDANELYGLYVKREGNQYFILKFDIEEETYKKIPLPETNKLEDFRMEIEHEGRSAGAFSPPPMPTIVKGKIILTNNAFNEAYVYDTSMDSLYLISWNSTLTGNKNEAKLPKKVQLEAAEKHMMKFYESINFLTPQWDPVSEQFIRLSYKTKFAEVLDEIGESKEISSEVFLTVLDRNLNIIKETVLDQYKKTPPRHFYYDNTIWLYENIDDELGFVRITLN